MDDNKIDNESVVASSVKNLASSIKKVSFVDKITIFSAASTCVSFLYGVFMQLPDLNRRVSTIETTVDSLPLKFTPIAETAGELKVLFEPLKPVPTDLKSLQNDHYLLKGKVEIIETLVKK